MQFASLVSPVAHEGRNLKLVDFYDYSHGLSDEISVTYYDIDELKALAERLDIEKLPHIQKTKNGIQKAHFLFRCIVFARFRSDYLKFNYNYSKAQFLFLPLSYAVILKFRVVYRITWWLKYFLLKR